MKYIQIIMLIVLFSCQSESIVNGAVERFEIRYDSNEIVVLDFMRTLKGYIVFVIDKAKNIFLIKQVRSSLPQRQLFVVREMLGSYIAELCMIAANSIKIIPVNCDFTGKLYTGRPATLHTVVPGCPVTHLSNADEFYIHQPMYKKEVPQKEWGLTYRVIHNMSLHPDLPAIVALDTFIGNGDRQAHNFFYDKQSNKFFAIDLESSFRKPLASLACSLIDSMIKDQRLTLTAQELNGLVIYRNTLKKLIQKNPPNQLQQMLDIFVMWSGIGDTISSDNHIEQEIQLYKKIIFKNYASAQELVELLNKLIEQQSVSKNAPTYEYDFRLLWFVQERDACSCLVCQSMNIYNIKLDCSKSELDYIADRIFMYKKALFANEIAPLY